MSVLAYAVFFAGFGPWLIDLMTTSAEVRASARLYLFWMVLAPLSGWLAWMLDGIFIGAVRTRDMRNMMAISFLGYLATVWILMGVWGNHGLWAALILFFIYRGVTLAFVYPRIARGISE